MHGVPIDPPLSIPLPSTGKPAEGHRSEIIFYLNGERRLATGDELRLTLGHWLRKHRGLVGTKVMCNEGDCGACSVLVGRTNATKPDELQYQTIDSCIAFLFQLDRCHVITVEGLIRSNASNQPLIGRQLTAIQQAMVDCHGSQCGFCTPGFIMTMHGMIESGQTLDDDNMRYGLSGNLCRCTGYVQILEAGRRAAAQIDENNSLVSRLSQQYDETAMLKDFETFAFTPVQSSGCFQTLIPLTIEQACQYRAIYPGATCVAGATDYGVLRNHHRLAATDVIYLGQVDSHTRFIHSKTNESECGFQDIVITADRMTIGAGATWTEIERAMDTRVPEYHRILTRFGSPQIRNRGTIGGNLATGSPIADSVPFHMVLDTEIELASVRGRRSVRIEDFYRGYRKTILEPDELIVNIQTRLPTQNERLRLFKISKRRDMDISTVTFALLANVENDRIIDAKIALGGVGPQVMRMGQAEAFLCGKIWSPETLRDAGRILRSHVTPWTDVRGGADYRCRLVENLIVRSYYPSEPSLTVDSLGGADE